METYYINEKTIEEKRLKYLRAHNSVKAFIEEVIDWEASKVDNYITKSDLHLVYNIYCGIYRLPVDNYDTFCKRVKKTKSVMVDKEETTLVIDQERKTLGEKDTNGKPKTTPCWMGLKLTEEYTKELLDAKAKAKAKELQEEGQENLD